MYMWGPEVNLLESVLSCHSPIPELGDQNQAARLDSKCLHLLSHLLSPQMFTHSLFIHYASLRGLTQVVSVGSKRLYQLTPSPDSEQKVVGSGICIHLTPSTRETEAGESKV